MSYFFPECRNINCGDTEEAKKWAEEMQKFRHSPELWNTGCSPRRCFDGTWISSPDRSATVLPGCSPVPAFPFAPSPVRLQAESGESPDREVWLFPQNGVKNLSRRDRRAKRPWFISVKNNEWKPKQMRYFGHDWKKDIITKTLLMEDILRQPPRVSNMIDDLDAFIFPTEDDAVKAMNEVMDEMEKLEDAEKLSSLLKLSGEYSKFEETYDMYVELWDGLQNADYFEIRRNCVKFIEKTLGDQCGSYTEEDFNLLRSQFRFGQSETSGLLCKITTFTLGSIAAFIASAFLNSDLSPEHGRKMGELGLHLVGQHYKPVVFVASSIVHYVNIFLEAKRKQREFDLTNQLRNHVLFLGNLEHSPLDTMKKNIPLITLREVHERSNEKVYFIVSNENKRNLASLSYFKELCMSPTLTQSEGSAQIVAAIHDLVYKGHTGYISDEELMNQLGTKHTVSWTLSSLDLKKSIIAPRFDHDLIELYLHFGDDEPWFRVKNHSYVLDPVLKRLIAKHKSKMKKIKANPAVEKWDPNDEIYGMMIYGISFILAPQFIIDKNLLDEYYEEVFFAENGIAQFMQAQIKEVKALGFTTVPNPYHDSDVEKKLQRFNIISDRTHMEWLSWIWSFFSISNLMLPVLPFVAYGLYSILTTCAYGQNSVVASQQDIARDMSARISKEDSSDDESSATFSQPRTFSQGSVVTRDVIGFLKKRLFEDFTTFNNKFLEARPDGTKTWKFKYVQNMIMNNAAVPTIVNMFHTFIIEERTSVPSDARKDERGKVRPDEFGIILDDLAIFYIGFLNDLSPRKYFSRFRGYLQALQILVINPSKEVRMLAKIVSLFFNNSETYRFNIYKRKLPLSLKKKFSAKSVDDHIYLRAPEIFKNLVKTQDDNDFYTMQAFDYDEYIKSQSSSYASLSTFFGETSSNWMRAFTLPLYTFGSFFMIFTGMLGLVASNADVTNTPITRLTNISTAYLFVYDTNTPWYNYMLMFQSLQSMYDMATYTTKRERVAWSLVTMLMAFLYVMYSVYTVDAKDHTIINHYVALTKIINPDYFKLFISVMWFLLFQTVKFLDPVHAKDVKKAVRTIGEKNRPVMDYAQEIVRWALKVIRDYPSEFFSALMGINTVLIEYEVGYASMISLYTSGGTAMTGVGVNAFNWIAKKTDEQHTKMVQNRALDIAANATGNAATQPQPPNPYIQLGAVEYSHGHGGTPDVTSLRARSQESHRGVRELEGSVQNEILRRKSSNEEKQKREESEMQEKKRKAKESQQRR